MKKKKYCLRIGLLPIWNDETNEKKLCLEPGHPSGEHKEESCLLTNLLLLGAE
jgi:hypothetical protein